MEVTQRINSTIYSNSDFLVLWWKDTSFKIKTVIELEELTCFNIGDGLGIKNLLIKKDRRRIL